MISSDSEGWKMRDQPTEPVTYSSYLCLDTLLAAQRPMSEEHDEVLFIIIHQTW